MSVQRVREDPHHGTVVDVMPHLSGAFFLTETSRVYSTRSRALCVKALTERLADRFRAGPVAAEEALAEVLHPVNGSPGALQADADVALMVPEIDSWRMPDRVDGTLEDDLTQGYYDVYRMVGNAVVTIAIPLIDGDENY